LLRKNFSRDKLYCDLTCVTHIDAGTDCGNSLSAGPREARQQLYEEYIHDDFSFGNRHKFRGEEDTDKYGPRLDSNFRSSSTAELTQKVEDDESKRSNMPPPTVMLKLISVMTFRKLIRNPNTYSSLIGVVWSLISYRYV